MTQIEKTVHASAARLSVTGGKFQAIPLVQVNHTSPQSDAEAEFQHLLDWVGQGVQAMEGIEDEQVREQVFALLEGMDIVHREGLARLLDLISTADDQHALATITGDRIVQTLLELYDLPEISERDQVEQALKTVYPYIESHGGRLELLDVQNGHVRVRLSGSCGSCPGSAGTLQRVVEDTLRQEFPNFMSLVAEDPIPPQATTIQIGPTVRRRPRWVDLGILDEFPVGEMRALWPEGHGVLVVQIDGDVYAHQNACPPGSALALHLGSLDGSTLICPWHGCRYDIRTGKRLDAEGKLGVLPVAVKDGVVKVAMGLEEVTIP